MLTRTDPGVIVFTPEQDVMNSWNAKGAKVAKVADLGAVHQFRRRA
jgi:hypothetical protein